MIIPYLDTPTSVVLRHFLHWRIPGTVDDFHFRYTSPVFGEALHGCSGWDSIVPFFEYYVSLREYKWSSCAMLRIQELWNIHKSRTWKHVIYSVQRICPGIKREETWDTFDLVKSCRPGCRSSEICSCAIHDTIHFLVNIRIEAVKIFRMKTLRSWGFCQFNWSYQSFEKTGILENLYQLKLQMLLGFKACFFFEGFAVKVEFPNP